MTPAPPHPHPEREALNGSQMWSIGSCSTAPQERRDCGKLSAARVHAAALSTLTASFLVPLFSRLFAGSIPRVTFISLGGFIFLGAYEKARRTLL